MASPSIPDILARKRDGQELTQEEIQAFVNAVVNDGAQKEQIGEQLFLFSLSHIFRCMVVMLMVRLFR